MRRLPAGRTMRGAAEGNRRIASQTAGEKNQAAKNGVDGDDDLRRPRFFAKASGGGHLGRLTLFSRSVVRRRLEKAMYGGEEFNSAAMR